MDFGSPDVKEGKQAEFLVHESASARDWRMSPSTLVIIMLGLRRRTADEPALTVRATGSRRGR
ncbi:MAG: hypothetical protein ACLP0J_05345 [Solirubrobacteraceae bacterium]